MQKKISYPKNGIVMINGSRYLCGQAYFRNKQRYYFIPRYDHCTHAFWNSKNQWTDDCGLRATFYGYEQIGPRVYAIHKCVLGHKNLTRLINDDGPELTVYLKEKYSVV